MTNTALERTRLLSESNDLVLNASNPLVMWDIASEALRTSLSSVKHGGGALDMKE